MGQDAAVIQHENAPAARSFLHVSRTHEYRQMFFSHHLLEDDPEFAA